MDGRPMNISELLLVLATLLFSSRDHKSRKISFQGWKIMYKNSKTSKNYLSVIWAYMPGMTRIVCNLSSFHLFVTTHIFITFNHLCTLWRFPLIPANKYPAVLGLWIEACRQKSDCVTVFFSAYKHSTGALCSPCFRWSQSQSVHEQAKI